MQYLRCLTCMVRMHRMFGMFVLHVFCLFCKLWLFRMFFQNVQCVTCDTSVVMDFRKFRPASLFSHESLGKRSRLCSGFPRSSFFFLDRHCLSDALFNSVHNSHPRRGFVFEKRWNFNFNAVSSVCFTNFYVRDRAESCIAFDPPFAQFSFSSRGNVYY